MKKVQRITAFIICLAIVLTSAYALGQRMMPERMDFGAVWGRYAAEPEDSLDVLFVGSSIAYCDVKPSIIYENTGITSFMVCGPELTASLSYYYLKEALKTQSPKTVILEGTSFFFGKYTSFTKVNVGYMPFSFNRLGAVFRASEKEQRKGLLFPLFNYHSRWNDEQVTYTGPRGDSLVDMYAGYTFVDDVVPQEERSEREYYLSGEQLEENLGWLRKIIELCENKGIEPVIYVAPQCKYPSQELMDALRTAAEGVTVIDFNDSFDDLGLDISHDFHDSLHLNCYGADKFSIIMAHSLESLNVVSGHTKTELWDSRVEYEKNACLNEE